MKTVAVFLRAGINIYQSIFYYIVVGLSILCLFIFYSLIPIFYSKGPEETVIRIAITAILAMGQFVYWRCGGETLGEHLDHKTLKEPKFILVIGKAISKFFKDSYEYSQGKKELPEKPQKKSKFTRSVRFRRLISLKLIWKIN